MKKIYNLHSAFFIIVFSLIIIITSESCSKQLTILPTDQVDATTVFSNIPNLNAAVLGVYSNWKEEYLVRVGSVLSDECRIGLKNSGIGITGSGQNLFRWAFTANDEEVTDPWANPYQVISQVNSILASIDKVPVSNAADQAEKQNLKGELLAIRAFEHFELYRVYGFSGVYDSSKTAIPYITGTNIYALPSRPSSAVFFTALHADMAAADSFLNNSNNDINRFGTNALHALEARVAVYTNDWPEAINNASKVIGAVPLSSYANFPAIWTDQSTDEVVFELSRTNQSALRPGDLWYNIGFGVQLFAPSKTLMNLYDSTADIRYHSYFTTDSSQISLGELPDIISKYQGTTGAQNLNNLKVFRTGEMYLIRAEAYAETGDLTDANADLNYLRSKRISGYRPFNYTSLQDIMTAILNERYKELPFEGHRYYDLKRKGLTIVRQSVDLPSNMANSTLTPSSMYYYIPIPQTEVLANPDILPNNPGW